jgi:CheY-like chemotaxis protein
MQNEPSDQFRDSNDRQLTSSNNSAFVFLAEDDVDDQELLIEALTGYNNKLHIKTVLNGKKAINELEAMKDEELPCLVILDYNLPEVNGGEILKFLSGIERYRFIPKVVWSTSNSSLYRQQCLDLGARAYFVKPSDVTGIEKLAREMLAFCDAL